MEFPSWVLQGLQKEYFKDCIGDALRLQDENGGEVYFVSKFNGQSVYHAYLGRCLE